MIRKNRPWRTTEKGFTLIEILVVLLLLGLLVGIVAPRVLRHIGPSKLKAAKAQITALETVVQEYYLQNSRYPTREEGLEVLSSLMGKEIPKDPWNNDYYYIYPGDHGDFDIISYGRDGREGGEGEDQDVVSWRGVEE